MGLPKKNIRIKLQKQLNSERVSLVERLRQNESFLPKGVLHEDLDNGFVDFTKKKLSLNIDGKEVPVIFLSIQNWNEFTKTWQFADKYKNIQMPFITIVRNTDVVLSDKMKYNIPYLYKKPLIKVPVWNGTRNGYDIYEIPQPIHVDVQYEVRLFSTRLRELNEFNKIVLTEFSSAQAYTDVNGHYIPITLDGVDDEHEINDINKKRFYVQKYNFILHGFLLDEEEFIIKPAVTRILTNYKFLGERRNKKTQNVSVNRFNDGHLEIFIDFFVDSPLNVSFVVDGEYTINGLMTDNTDLIEIKKNGMSVSPTFNLIQGDVVDIIVTQASSSINSSVTLLGTYNANLGAENFITDVDTSLAGYYFEKKTIYELLYNSNTSELTFNILYPGILKDITNVEPDITSYNIYQNNNLVSLPLSVNTNDEIKITIIRVDITQPTHLTAIQIFNNSTVIVNG
jgi:hypothetical protein